MNDRTESTPCCILYTNWRGRTRWRTVVFHGGTWRFGVTEHHAEPQWIVDVTDVDIGETRTLALASIHEWQGVPA